MNITIDDTKMIVHPLLISFAILLMILVVENLPEFGAQSNVWYVVSALIARLATYGALGCIFGSWSRRVYESAK